MYKAQIICRIEGTVEQIAPKIQCDQTQPSNQDLSLLGHNEMWFYVGHYFSPQRRLGNKIRISLDVMEMISPGHPQMKM
jgi:hypothetical protein